MANFFMGYALLPRRVGAEPRDRGLGSPGAAALPACARAPAEGARHAERNNINLAEIINAANTYVEIQEALIARV